MIQEKGVEIYSLITNHHKRDDNYFIKLLQACDRLDSADDKGIVRKKQSIENTIVCSPFGYPKERIDTQCLQKRLKDLEDRLIGLLKNYIPQMMNIDCFRKSLINDLKTTFSHALGETRIPANDVTLWDHSYSTASLFKSVLCAIVLGENLDPNKLQWRIFGLCWDGIGFVNEGKKIADIQTRNEILGKIRDELKNKFEDEIPIGNAIYEDINGIYFTFPDISKEKLKGLVKRCAEIGLETITKESNNEVWPFFILSRPSRSLTIIADVLRFVSRKRNIPKISPTIFIEEKEEKIGENPEPFIPKEKEDICPVCRMRTKLENNERCGVCEERKRGRLSNWFTNREYTIWTEEVADRENRIALLSLSFNLEKWLDGTMIGTIYSQSFNDWANSDKMKDKDIAVTPDIQTVYKLLETIENYSNNEEEAVGILNTFFEDITVTPKMIDVLISNIKERIEPNNLTKENLATYLFTQNPSPSRLYRIWKETEEFFGLVINAIKDKIYHHKWKRIRLNININDLGLKQYSEYIIKIEELKPQSLLVFHASGGEFYTIESIEKFKFREKSGIWALKDALKNGFYWIAEEEKPNTNLLQNREIKVSNTKIEEYYPFIEITKSPLLLRIIVPALDSIKILNLVVRLFNERFEKVMEKLPLDVGLLVSKRKFPLYVLLDASGRLFQNKEFKEPVMMDIPWDIEGIRNDKYYGFYPTTQKDKYTLNDLAGISKGKLYALYPGYFDFDLLLGTTDRCNIIYKERKRMDDYKLFSERPYYFYQISRMIDLWEILKNSLSSSQINFIEEALANKLRGWREINEKDRGYVFRKFAEATLKDAFANNWEKLRKESQDFLINSSLNRLLLDTIILFRHVIKEDENE
ncbi:TPA: CRISPR-associated protein Csx11 [bacterium]|nr:CRISPR-associated protein Csx11 [bacterium]